MSTNAKTQNSSVAMQQKSAELQLDTLTNEQLHQAVLEQRDNFYKHCDQTHKYAAEVLLPACMEIISRYKMQGIAAKDRPNGKPTVDAYFRSIGLNYNNVRSWIHRNKLRTEIFQPVRAKTGKEENKVSQLTVLESRLLGAASAGHDLVKAIKQGGNVDEAIKDFQEHSPSPERIEDYIERQVAAYELKSGDLIIIGEKPYTLVEAPSQVSIGGDSGLMVTLSLSLVSELESTECRPKPHTSLKPIPGLLDLPKAG